MPFDGFSFSINIFILGVFLLSMLYGILLGQSRIKTFVLSVFVGTVLATELASVLHGRWLSNWVTSETTRFILFTAPLLLLELNHSREKLPKAKAHKHRDGMLITLVISVLAAGLITASVIHLADPALQQQILGQSFLALFIYKLRLWWIGLSVLAITVKSLMGSGRSRY